MAQKVDRRKRVIVDTHLQVQILLRLAGALLVSQFAFFGLTLGAMTLLGRLSYVADWTATETARRLDVLASFVLLPMACSALLFFCFGARELFRIAGPVHHFEQVFRRLESLRIPRSVSIRHGDYLQDTARSLDRTVKALHRELNNLQRCGRAAVSAAEDATPYHPESLETLRRRLSELDRALARFDLEGEGAESACQANPETQSHSATRELADAGP